MSNSRRKTPIYGMTTCQSERRDKKIWHKKWRTNERTLLNALSHEGLNEHISLMKNEVSSTWSMGKDGRSYWPVSKQRKSAERIAGRKGHNPQEKAAIKKRLLHKWMGK